MPEYTSLSELTAAGEQLAEADMARDAAMARVESAIAAARDEGVPVAVVSRTTGLSRMSVYKIHERLDG